MITKLTIISTCTNKKKTRGDPPISLDDCVEATWEETLDLWLDRFNAPGVSKAPAYQVYGGTHWHETQACLDSAVANGFEAELWVMSAGAGLIPATFPIPFYSATFARGENSIHSLAWPHPSTPKMRCRCWWQALNSRRKASLPRCLPAIKSIGVGSAERCVIVICSPDYFSAVEPELLELAAKAQDLLVFSAGVSSDARAMNPILRQCLTPIDDRFKQIAPDLNKVNAALNARIARWVVDQHADVLRAGSDAVQEFLTHIGHSLVPLPRRVVVAMTDDDVLAYIAENYQSGKSSATSLLRHLRATVGKSCEQKRFGRLFAQFEETRRRGGLFDAKQS